MAPIESQFKDKPVRIATGRGDNLGRAKNETPSWDALTKKLADPAVSRETLKAFLDLPKDEQNRLKSINGWFVGGQTEGNCRKKAGIMSRDLITFDIDAGSPEMIDEIERQIAEICEYEFVLHSTRKHTPEKPRVRMVMLCDPACDPDQYEAVARILAHKIDKTINSIDDVSFRRNQLMYWPTCSKGQKFFFLHNHGKPVTPAEVLKEWGGEWRDFSQLPHSEQRGKARKRAGKSENPLEKKGTVGAFCRAFDVETAIAEFLADIYTSGDAGSGETRYTYNDGEGANGVIIYNEGLFAYSHHNTDPAGGENCNAFDLVRIHKFGHKDKNVDRENTPITEWPSYKEMVRWANDLEEVRRQKLEEKYDLVAMFDDIPDDDERAKELRDPDREDDIDEEIEYLLQPSRRPGLPDTLNRRRPKKPKKNWPQTDLELTIQGTIKKTVWNASVIISNDTRTWGVIALNEFSGKPVAKSSLRSMSPYIADIVVKDEENGEPWQDIHDHSLRALLSAPAGQGKNGWSFQATDRDLKSAVAIVASRWTFHPVQTYLESLQWDKESRVERLWIDYLGLPDTPYARMTARLFMTAAVARIYHPGHKWDFAPILSGAQGIRKSTFVATLFDPKWAGELTAHMAADKDAVEQMLGKWVLELPELANMRRSESEDVKAFLTRLIDEVRLAYDRRMSQFPRQCVFMGTTNAEEYLKDPTGARRFWPLYVRVPMIDTEKLEAERDQLWAEAFQIWAEMCAKFDYRNLPLMLDGEALREAEQLQSMAQEESSAVATGAAIEAWLNKPQRLSKFTEKDIGGMTGDDPLVIPVVTTPRQAFCEATGISNAEMAKNRTLDNAAGEAMKHVDGWHKAGSRLKVPGYGTGNKYVRDDATPFELAQRYRFVEPNDSVDNLL